jgi:hypothetical protein
MAFYRVGSPVGPPVRDVTPHAVQCEVCREELDDVVQCEVGQDKYFGLSAAGITRIWPSIKPAVDKHEAACKGKKG